MSSTPSSSTISLELFSSISDWFRSQVRDVPFSTEDKLVLYGLYKQGKHGALPDSMKRPSNPLDLKGRAKFDSWKKVSHLSPAEARQAYIDLLFERTETYLDDVAIRKGHKEGLFSPNPGARANNTSATTTAAAANKRRHRHTMSHPNPALLADMPNWVSVFENYRSIVAGEKEGTSFYLDGDSSGSEDEDEEEDDDKEEAKKEATEEAKKADKKENETDSDVEISGSEAKLNEPGLHKRTISAPPTMTRKSVVLEQTEKVLSRATKLESQIDELIKEEISPPAKQPKKQRFLWILFVFVVLALILLLRRKNQRLLERLRQFVSSLLVN